MSPRVVGIDLSLTSTGLADSHGTTLRIKPKPPAGDDLAGQIDRLNRICSDVAGFIDLRDDDGTYDLADLVVIEGPAYSRALGAGFHGNAGMWWAAARVAWAASEGAVLIVPPNLRAMYATGSGSAGKDEVLAAAVRRYPTFDITGNDVGDAVILAAIGARMLGHPIDDLPKTHLRALTKLALPPER